MGGNPKGEKAVYIGNRPTMNYVTAIIMVFNESKFCTVKARGRAISKAVDVCEVLKNRYMKDVKYKNIVISTENITGKDGKENNVSSMEIYLTTM